jgi:parallel beta-helix repeat protein
MAKVPHIFANVPGGNVPAAYLDDNFLTNNPTAVYANDTGTVNSLSITVAFPTQISSVASMQGYLFTVVPAVTSTGAATISINTYSSVPVLMPDGTVLQPYALIAGQPVTMYCTGGAMVLVDYAGAMYRNAPAGYTGNLLNLSVGGTSVFSVNQAGEITGLANAAPYIEDFGGGVGVADNGPAITAMLTAGYPVRFREGTYTVINGLSILATECAFLGVPGKTTILRGTVNLSAGWIDILSSSIYLDGVIFDNNVVVTTAIGKGLQVLGGSNFCAIKNCSFNNNQSPISFAGAIFAPGLYFGPLSPLTSTSYLFENCTATNNATDGFYIGDVNSIAVKNCVAYSNAWSGIHFVNSSGGMSDILIDNCICYNNLGQGISISPIADPTTGLYSYTLPTATKVSITNNVAYNNGNYNIYTGALSNSVVSGNLLYYNNSGTTAQSYGACILGDCCSNTIISNNVIYGNSYFGIDAASTNNCVISNNIITGCTVSLNCGGSNELVIRGNTFSGFGGWGVGLQLVEGDGSGDVFDGVQQYGVIDGNHINYTGAQNAIQIADNCYKTTVSNNTLFSTTDTLALNAVKNISNSTVFSNNVHMQAPSYPVTSSGSVVLPDALQDVVFNVQNPSLTLSAISLNTPANVVGTGIGYITVTSGGSGYASGSTTVSVTITGGGGSGAAATAFVYNGSVIAVRVTAFGTGYTSAPTIGFVGTNTIAATATAHVGLDINPTAELSILAINNAVNISAFANYTALYTLPVNAQISAYWGSGNTLNVSSTLGVAGGAQPSIAANAGKVLTGPATLGGTLGTLSVGGDNGLVETDASGNITAQTVLATGATTARALGAIAADEINVKNYGAVLNGSTSDGAAFQAAYNAVPNNGIIDIPTGGLNAPITPVSTKSVLWRTLGTLDYGTSAPGTNPVINYGDGDVLETFLGGRKRFSKKATNNTTSGYGVLEVDLTTNYASGATPAGNVNSGILVSASQNSPAPNAGVWAISATTKVNSNADDSIAVSATTIIGTAGAGSSIALYSQVLDSYGDAGNTTACEFDIYTVAADPISTLGPGKGKRAIVVLNAGLQGTPSVVPEVSRGIELGCNGIANIGSGFSAGSSARLYYAAFDCSQATFLTTDSTGNAVKVAAYRMGPNQPIDFSAQVGSSILNNDTLLFNSTAAALQYQHAGAPMLSVSTTGNAAATGVVTQGVYGVSPASGATVTIPNNVRTVYIRGSTTLASLTINLPVAPVDNQELVIILQVAVTSLTITPAAGFTMDSPIIGAPVTTNKKVWLVLDGTVWC